MYRGSDSKGLCWVCTKYTSVVFVLHLLIITPKPPSHIKTRRQPLPTASRKHARLLKKLGCAKTVPVRYATPYPRGSEHGPAPLQGGERLCWGSRVR